MKFLAIGLLVFATLIAAPAPEREKAIPSAHHRAVGVPDWARGSTIYEINVRQFSASGKFAAVTADLPRLKALGVDILWLIPSTR